MIRTCAAPILTALGLATLTLTAAPAAADPGALQTLSGTWASPAPEPWYGGWGQREFVLSGGQWTLTFTHALDRDMTQRTFQFRTGGAYRVGAPSDVVPGAWRTAFDEDWKHVTLLARDPGLVAAMGMADCGLVPNLETDISDTGCAAWRPVADCGTDHDLLAQEGTGLRFGVRPADNDMCTPDRTPTALLPAVQRR
ncbi:MAG TPA: hypothetical protein VLA78_07170 [Paracoccaceae bacterium]|nr:hypothetical protein [Paracoccaceae bacterium]